MLPKPDRPGAILFYSQSCQYCTQIIQTIRQKQIGIIKMINVDVVSVPDSITQVPTLIVKGFIKPLIGKQVFDWIDSLEYFHQNTNNVNIKCSNKQLQIDTSKSYIKLDKANKFTSLGDEDDNILVHGDVKTGYDHSILKSYKENTS